MVKRQHIFRHNSFTSARRSCKHPHVTGVLFLVDIKTAIHLLSKSRHVHGCAQTSHTNRHLWINITSHNLDKSRAIDQPPYPPISQVFSENIALTPSVIIYPSCNNLPKNAHRPLKPLLVQPFHQIHTPLDSQLSPHGLTPTRRPQSWLKLGSVKSTDPKTATESNVPSAISGCQTGNPTTIPLLNIHAPLVIRVFERQYQRCLYPPKRDHITPDITLSRLHVGMSWESSWTGDPMMHPRKPMPCWTMSRWTVRTGWICDLKGKRRMAGSRSEMVLALALADGSKSLLYK